MFLFHSGQFVQSDDLRLSSTSIGICIFTRTGAMCSPSSVAYGIETDFVYAWRMEFSIYNIANYVNTCIFLVDSIASNNIHTHAQRLTIGLSANRNANCREMVTESKRDRAHA